MDGLSECPPYLPAGLHPGKFKDAVDTLKDTVAGLVAGRTETGSKFLDGSMLADFVEKCVGTINSKGRLLQVPSVAHALTERRCREEAEAALAGYEAGVQKLLEDNDTVQRVEESYLLEADTFEETRALTAYDQGRYYGE
jgi:hypothetical protein